MDLQQSISAIAKSQSLYKFLLLQFFIIAEIGNEEPWTLPNRKPLFSILLLFWIMFPVKEFKYYGNDD